MRRYSILAIVAAVVVSVALFATQASAAKPTLCESTIPPKGHTLGQASKARHLVLGSPKTLYAFVGVEIEK